LTQEWVIICTASALTVVHILFAELTVMDRGSTHASHKALFCAGFQAMSTFPSTWKLTLLLSVLFNPGVVAHDKHETLTLLLVFLGTVWMNGKMNCDYGRQQCWQQLTTAKQTSLSLDAPLRNYALTHSLSLQSFTSLLYTFIWWRCLI